MFQAGSHSNGEIKEGLMQGLIVKDDKEPTEDVEETTGSPKGELYWSMVRAVSLGEKPHNKH